jgi:hypothetical protein
LIKEAVELNYDEFLSKDYEKAWKKCSRCGKVLLRDPRNFVRKSKAVVWRQLFGTRRSALPYGEV